jgi:hypothetical protein
MNANPKRRDVVKALAGAGGLVALGSVATAAQANRNDKPAGGWLDGGRKDEPCANFQQGSVLLLVNKNGDLATAMMTEAKKFTVKANIKGWDEGLIGELVEEGKQIKWSNGSVWKRA